MNALYFKAYPSVFHAVFLYMLQRVFHQVSTKEQIQLSEVRLLKIIIQFQSTTHLTTPHSIIVWRSHARTITHVIQSGANLQASLSGQSEENHLSLSIRPISQKSTYKDVCHDTSPHIYAVVDVEDSLARKTRFIGLKKYFLEDISSMFVTAIYGTASIEENLLGGDGDFASGGRPCKTSCLLNMLL